MPYDELRIQFRQQSEHLIRKIYSALQPKRVNGIDLTGNLYAELIQQYCESMNSNGLPKINSSWTRVLESEIRRVKMKASKRLKKMMNKLFTEEGELPIELDELRQVEKQI